jgi:hypothetical protein
MVCLDFFGCIIDTICLSGNKVLIFKLGFFLFKKKNSKKTIMPLKKREYACVKGFYHLFFYWNNLNIRLSLSFDKNKVTCRGVFIV